MVSMITAVIWLAVATFLSGAVIASASALRGRKWVKPDGVMKHPGSAFVDGYTVGALTTIAAVGWGIVIIRLLS